MQLSLNWLQDFIDIPKDITPEKFGDLLTLHTVEVEGMMAGLENLDNIYVGKIINIENHPNADKLKMVTVDLSKGKYRVVCGGSNLYTGMLVCFAKVGAHVRWHGQGDLLELQPAVIRGEKSEGMICAASEVGLENLFPADNESQVIDLPQDYKVGNLLIDELPSYGAVYDIDNKSMTHRPDLWGHYGMARDASAWLDAELKPYKLQEIKPGKDNINIEVKDIKACPRYMAIAMDNITVQPSPDWIQQRLSACGVRPINNIVDITNYVMLELGQPTHAFDAEKLGQNIIVRPALSGEKITTLDKQVRKLSDDMLLITNKEKPVAIAGVMGSDNSEIDQTTNSIIIEAANFDPVAIRKTSQKLGLRTDASMRFEKALDPQLCELALKRIVGLVQEFCPQATASSQICDVNNFQPSVSAIDLNLDWARKKIGADISDDDMCKILEALGFAIIKHDGKVISVDIPSWRSTKDVSIAEDLVEEIARIYGYNKITPVMPLVDMRRPLINQARKLRLRIQDMLVSLGMTETYNYAFVNEDQLTKLNITYDNYIKLANPLSKEYTLLRQHLLPNLLNNVITNQRNYDIIKLFEIGNVFLPTDSDLYKDSSKKQKLPAQEMKLGLVYAANENNEGDNFKQLKGVLQRLGDSLNLDFAFSKQKGEIVIKVDDVTVGDIQYIEKNIAKKIGLKVSTIIAEISLSILPIKQLVRQYKPKNKFPALMRDMAFVFDKKIMYNDIKNAILKTSALIQDVDVFDVYVGDRINKDKKSIAMHITFSSDEKTLTGADVDRVQKQIVKNLADNLQARLRDF